uniref:Uncharacterized protein n=2 Tax=Timema TaxID=61471 RepID=A0A7R9E4H2_9NEOP|nr:unnamed protein product [Timema cristinae]CAD7427268.1 unnamed protein product [Timema monikensis]
MASKYCTLLAHCRIVPETLQHSWIDILALAASIQELCVGSRKARTGMWCALTTTLLSQENDKSESKEGEK